MYLYVLQHRLSFFWGGGGGNCYFLLFLLFVVVFVAVVDCRISSVSINGLILKCRCFVQFLGLVIGKYLLLV